MWYVVRHPETEWNRQRRYQGWSNIPLSAHGEEQCRQLIQRLSRLTDIALVLASDLERCRIVAEPVATRLAKPLLLLPTLRELNFGLWEGLTFSEIEQRYPQEQTAWLDDPSRVAPPGGETLEQLETRVQQALQPYEQQNALIVTHGGVLATINSLWGQADFWLPPTGQVMTLNPTS